MMTLKEIQNKVDLVISRNWAHIQERQEAYFAAHKRYFQGLSTHSTKPADGVETTPNALLSKPTDQAESWNDAGFVLPAKLPARITMNTYEGPDGHGYEVVMGVEVKGRQYRRTLQHGPEEWRAHGWVEVIGDG